MKPYILLAVAAILTSCATTQPKPEVVNKSFYLNKPLLTFELNNGSCNSKKPTPDGGYINNWQSDSGNIIANALNWNSYPYCKLELTTDKNSIVRKIRILENDIKCAYVLR
jgi:hypothetical protein